MEETGLQIWRVDANMLNKQSRTADKEWAFSSQETHCASAKKPNRLMLFRETVAVYCENHTEHTDTFCGQIVEI
jgi:hypothetical protein